MSRFCFIAKNPAAKNSHLHDLCRIGTKHSIHGRLTNNMHRVNVSMILNGVLPYGVQAANARFRVAPARTIEVRHKAGRRPRIDGEHLKPARLLSSFFYLFCYACVCSRHRTLQYITSVAHSSISVFAHFYSCSLNDFVQFRTINRSVTASTARGVLRICTQTLTKRR